MSDRMLVPSKALLSQSVVSGSSYDLVPVNPYTTDVGNQVRSLLATTSEIRPILTSDASDSAQTWEIDASKLKVLLKILNESTYGINNIVNTCSSFIRQKLNETNEDWIAFNRLETSQLAQAYKWLNEQTDKIARELITANAVTKEVCTDLQSVPTDNVMTNNLAICESSTSVETALNQKVGQDEEFVEKFEPIINQLPTDNIETAVSDVILEAPAILGSEGSNVVPPTLDGTSVLQDSESKNANIQVQDEAYWTKLKDEVDEFLSPSTLTSNITEQLDLMVEMLQDEYTKEELMVTISATPSGGTAAQNYLTKITQYIPVTKDELLTGVEGKAIVDLDFTMQVDTTSLELVSRTVVDPEKIISMNLLSNRINVNSCMSYKDILSLDVSGFGNLTRNDLDGLKFKSIIKPRQSYSLERAGFFSKIASKVWNGLKNVKLSDIQAATNTISLGLSAAGKLSGIQGLTNASNALSFMNNGLSKIQSEIPALKNLLGNKVTRKDVYDTKITGTVYNTLPNAFSLGRNILQTRNKAVDSTVMDKTNIMSKKATAVKTALVNQLNIATEPVRTRMQKSIIKRRV